MKIENALIEVGSSGAGLLAAQAAENKIPGLIGPGVSLVAGGAAWYFGPDWAKPAGAVMAGFGALSAVKKLVFKPEKRFTGVLAEIESLLPGNDAVVTVNGLSMADMEEAAMMGEFDDFEMLPSGDSFENSLAGMGNPLLSQQLAGEGGDFEESAILSNSLT